jgi:hypothetical protein
MAPCIDKRLLLQCAGNGFDGEMSAGAAGIVACLMAGSSQHKSTFPTYPTNMLDTFFCSTCNASD